MKAVGRYDGNLQMFVEEPRDVDLRRLGFVRWLVENDRLEHPAIGPSTGELVVTVGPVVADAHAELPLAS
jgi:hypothetical protein